MSTMPYSPIDEESSSIEKREVSLMSSDHWNDADDDSFIEVSRPKYDGVEVQWNLCHGDDDVTDESDDEDMPNAENMLTDFTSDHSGIILGVSVSDRQHEVDERPPFPSKAIQIPVDDDDDQTRYIDELLNADVDSNDSLASSFIDELPTQLQVSFRKRRADLMASMERTRKTRHVLHQHIKQRASLTKVLTEIERSTQHIHMLIHGGDICTAKIVTKPRSVCSLTAKVDRKRGNIAKRDLYTI